MKVIELNSELEESLLRETEQHIEIMQELIGRLMGRCENGKIHPRRGVSTLKKILKDSKEDSAALLGDIEQHDWELAHGYARLIRGYDNLLSQNISRPLEPTPPPWGC
jgi:hypothetical protein